MEKKYKVVNLPKEPTRHHLGNFGLVLIKEDLPQEICEAGFKARLPYFEEIADEPKPIAVEEPKLIDEPAIVESEVVNEEPVVNQKALRGTK